MHFKTLGYVSTTREWHPTNFLFSEIIPKLYYPVLNYHNKVMRNSISAVVIQHLQVVWRIDIICIYFWDIWSIIDICGTAFFKNTIGWVCELKEFPGYQWTLAYQEQKGSFQPNLSNSCQVKNFKILGIFIIW